MWLYSTAKVRHF